MKVSVEELQERLDEKFGEGIVFDKGDYMNMNTKLDFWCKKHKEGIRRSPTEMLNTKGCRKCKLEQWKRTGFDEFVERAREVHGDRFEYFEKEYVSFGEHTKIMCKKHSEVFHQNPHKHLFSQGGCPSCKLETIANHHKFSQEEFTGKATKVHGDKYDYHAVEYVNVDTEVKIWCKKHQEYFWQIPYNHVNKEANCPSCVKENHGGWGRRGVYKTDRPCRLYLLEINAGNDSFLKIGLSVDYQDRVRRLSRHIPNLQSIKPIMTLEGPANQLAKVESRILWRSNLEKYFESDWDWAGRTECFNVGEKFKMIQKINQIYREVKEVL